ncbi:ste ste11 protein kinase [Plasmopara halstedii]|uniref:Ste ste11 protein kinase n=1 Tax=Plasmopara halstedii TaxID=4781 RepID=A0A0N7L437_PLAHL|nr:ste ste11 protein kinase [Plasmopara halstedii]CEG37587.1 ste ste11 protein kinase [Plasmopara halstedii]|eukprot:XP_024573956.1 ste ste11 protein kinase [Plasmopara halstedii]
MKDVTSSFDGLVLDNLHDDRLLLFPPSPEHSQACNNKVSEIESPTFCDKITSTKWVRKEKIGQGAQGIIYRCEDQMSGREIAVKVIWTKDLPLPAIEAVKREVKTMQRLRHRHLIRYYQATEKKERELRIYMEFAPHGSLRSQLSQFGPLSYTLVQRYTRQLCQALRYLHQNGIAHRDIKCANILLTTVNNGSRLDVKLADFGTLKLVGSASLVEGLKGTPQWMAPEIIRNQSFEEEIHFDYWFRADVWSLGCAVLEMITGHSPWQQYSNPLTTMYRIVSSNETPTIPTHVPTEIASFLMLCLQRDPVQRGTITHLLEHPFVNVSRTSRTRVRKWQHQNKCQDEMDVDKVVSKWTRQALSSRLQNNLTLEPEPHEDAIRLAHIETLDQQDKTRSNLQSSRSPDDRNKMLHIPLQDSYVESPGTRSLAHRRLPSSFRLKSLESTNKRILPDLQDTEGLFKTTNTPTRSLPSRLRRGKLEGTKRLPQVNSLRTGYDFESVLISPLQKKRSSTAPSSVTNTRATDELIPLSIQLPPLNDRIIKTWCRSTLTSS